MKAKYDYTADLEKGREKTRNTPYDKQVDTFEKFIKANNVKIKHGGHTADV